MGLLNILQKGLKAIIDEALTPKTFRVGEKFEKFVRENIFPEKYHNLVEKTHDYLTNSKDYVESSLKPDFKFRDKATKKQFYVEAKFRTSLLEGKIKWCNQRQLERYKRINDEIPVFIIIGFGNVPNNPAFIALLPLTKAKYVGLYPSYLKKYGINTKKPQKSEKMWSL